MSGLDFILGDVDTGGGGRPTTCVLSVDVGGARIWPVAGDVGCRLEVEIDDLLSHLARSWKALILRQTYPGRFNPDRPARLLSEAAARWGEMSEDLAAPQDEEVEAFADIHDLARAFAGLFDLPPLWLVRSGPAMLVDTGDTLSRIPIGAAIEGLVAVGETIAGRLEATGDDRWRELIEAWRRREDGAETAMAAWTTSLDEAEVRALAAQGLLALPLSFAEAAEDRDELRIAARMASALSLEEIGAILARVRAIGPADCPALERSAGQARVLLAGLVGDGRPYEAGEELARLVRTSCGLADGRAVDVFGLVEALAVPLVVADAGMPGLDALAIWGRAHGPAILLNGTSRRHAASLPWRDNPALRITLAHELCHLLADTGHALGAIDVLGGRMPAPVERRARAFAAELLLPTREAADAWIASGRPRDPSGVDTLLSTLADRYVVSRAVASWKLQHGASGHGADLQAVLDGIVWSR